MLTEVKPRSISNPFFRDEEFGRKLRSPELKKEKGKKRKIKNIQSIQYPFPQASPGFESILA